MRSPNRPWVLSWLLLCGACEGTSTGNPTTDPTHGGQGTGESTGLGAGNCELTSSMALAPDARTALGFSADDVLSFVAGTHEEKLTWHAQNGFEYGPESGEHALTLQVARKGAPRLAHYKPKSGLGEIALIGGNDCSDAIEIDVEVSITTDQGALNETFESTIVARNDKAVSLYVTLDPAKLGGSFAARNLAEGFRLLPLALSVQLTKYSTQGSLRASLERREGNGVSQAAGSREPLASWGPADCNYRGIAVPNAAVVDGFSGDDVIALLNRAPVASVAFEGSAPSTASLSFSAASERACAVLGGNGDATIGSVGSLYVQAAMRIKSADARIDATWPVAISVTPDEDGNIALAQLTFDDELPGQQESFAVRYGIAGIDVSRFDSASARLELSATPEKPLNGQLEVTGFKNAPCSSMVTINADGSGSSSGCMGATATTLARASIAAARSQ